MNARKYLAAFAFALCSLAAGCDNPQPPAGGDGDATTDSFIGRQVAEGIATAQRALETENIRIGSSHIHINGYSFDSGREADDLPEGEITPDGRLLIAGEEVPATPQQRALLLDYRGDLVGIAQAGMTIGAQGASIAGTALEGIGQALFGGEEGRRAYEARIEEEADKVRGEALKLCGLLPALYDSQQALAAAMPEFTPYARMTREDIDDCGRDAVQDAGTEAGTLSQSPDHPGVP